MVHFLGGKFEDINEHDHSDKDKKMYHRLIYNNLVVNYQPDCYEDNEENLGLGDDDLYDGCGKF